MPSEGKGHTFESCRVRHFTFDDPGAFLVRIGAETTGLRRVKPPHTISWYPREEWEAFFKQMGMSDASGIYWAEMIDGFNSGWITFDGLGDTRFGAAKLPYVLISLA